MVKFKHMDFDCAVWQLLLLCIDPGRTYRTMLYHSRTKHQWARDDPAFVVVLLYMLCATVVAWSVALDAHGSSAATLKLVVYAVVVDFLCVGALLATVGWWVGNHYMRSAAAKEAVEWRYAFDVHCNAFVPLFLLLHGVQLLLLPLLLRPGTLAAVASNALYALACSAYHYISFLGYSELPFLQRCEYMLYPIGLVVAGFLLSLPLAVLEGFNCSALTLSLYFD